MRRAARHGVLACALLLGPGAPAPAAEMAIGSGASVELGKGSLDLGCADLTVGGTVLAGTMGIFGARDVTIEATGVLNGGSGVIEVTGDWDKAGLGTFDANDSAVELVDGCSVSTAAIMGDTTFVELLIANASAKTYEFEAGSTQTITDTLRMFSTSGVTRIRSTVAGSEAFIDLQGDLVTDKLVNVQDNHAIGETLVAVSVGGNATGWMLMLAAVPALGWPGLAVVAGLLAWAGRRALRRT